MSESSLIGLSPQQFAEAFPFHLAIDREMTVRQVGRSLARVLPALTVGSRLLDHLVVEYPPGMDTFDEIVVADMLFILAAPDRSVRLRGQVITVGDGKMALFLASPWLDGPEDMTRLGLTLSDFARHDSVVDILQTIQAQKAALADLRMLAERLASQRAELRKTNEALTTEIADRRRAEANLREREERFETLLASASEAIVISDEKGTILLANARAEAMFGYTRAELTGQPVDVLVPRGVRAAHAGHRTAFIERPHTRPMGGGLILSGLHKGGAILPLEISLSYVETSEGMLVMTFLTDISERQRAAEELRSQRDFAVQVMGAMGQGLTVLDPDLRFEYVNPALGRLLGMDPALLVREPFLRVLDGNSGTLFVDELAEMENGRTVEVEVQVLGANSEALPVLLTCVPWQREGDAVAVIIVVTNLAERKQIEQAVAWARDRALEASRLKSDFLASVSHEIRTPLNSIIGVAEMLSEMRLEREASELVDLIGESGKVLLALINDILDFSKIEAGKLVLEETPFSLRACIEAAIDVVRTAAARKHLQLAYEMEPPVPDRVVGDETRLSQVLINLLSNAVKFTDAGSVTVRVSVEPGTKSKHEIAIDVRDTGLGIPVDRQDRLFQAFSQVDTSTTRRYGGTGLGLAISRRLCKAMGGVLWAESLGIPGKGSTFHCRLPLEIADWEPDREPVAPLAGKTMLLIADGTLLGTEVRHVTQLAQTWGMNVLECDSLDAARRLLESGSAADLVFASRALDLPDDVSWPATIRFRTLWERGNEALQPATGGLIQPMKALALRTALADALQAEQPDAGTLVPASQATAEHVPLRILVAEDTVVNQVVIRRMLDRLGYGADIVGSGTEALAAIDARPYDLAFMDMQMPDMDGLEATRRIRRLLAERGDGSHLTIVALTANVSPEDRAACMAAGMNDFLGKPLRIGDLREILRSTAAALAG
ncbi:MAG: ATP-binding protein [Caldilinea sp.]|nr:ATP-binding protein [Caldilinea sp.]